MARFTLTNTGGYDGADVTQAYVGMPAAAAEPPRQLKGFQKVSLSPGQSASVSIPLGATSFAHWSDRLGTWVITPGRYRIYVGDSSSLANLPLRATLVRRAARLAPGAY
jgi:beta-glucosidase